MYEDGWTPLLLLNCRDKLSWWLVLLGRTPVVRL
jgi:hypothetical protein